MGCIRDTQLNNIVALAARAPSGDNTQPWTFGWDGKALTIFLDRSKTQHVLDAGLSGAKLSLGCAVESVAIAASEYGLGINCEYLPLAERGRRAARISFEEVGRREDPLLDALPRRTTDRRLFKKGAMPRQELTEIWNDFDRRQDVRVDFVDALAPDLFEYVVAAECLVARHPAIFPDTLQWIRFSEREIERTRDGMPWRGCGINAFQYPVMQLMRAVPGAFRWFSRAGMANTYRARVRKLLRSSAGLLCIGTRRDDEFALVDVGRFAMRLWLRLTQLGYGVQPLSISSLSLYNSKIGVLDSESVRLFGARYLQGESILRKAFSIPAGSLPVWILRIGRSSPLPASWITPRRPLESILQVASSGNAAGTQEELAYSRHDH